MAMALLVSAACVPVISVLVSVVLIEGDTEIQKPCTLRYGIIQLPFHRWRAFDLMRSPSSCIDNRYGVKDTFPLV